MPERYADVIGQQPTTESTAEPTAVPAMDPSTDPNGTFRFTIDLDGERFAVCQSGPGNWGYEWLTGPNRGYGFGASGPPVDSLEEHRERIRAFLRSIDPATGFIRDV
jgi:hypothetical protein